MQFSFLGFSSMKIMEFNLDVKDIIILKYFNDFKNSGKMSFEVVNGEKYYWLSYQNIENELPFLGLAKRAIMARMLKMKKLGILKHYTKKDGGTFSYYTLGEKFNELLYTYTDNKKNSNHKDNYKDSYEDNDINFNSNNIDNNSKEDNTENFKFINNKKYKDDQALDELEKLFNFNNKSKNIKENLESNITKGIPFNEEGMSKKEYTTDKEEVSRDNYIEDIEQNLQKSVLFNEFKEQNVQGLALNSDRGCISKGRTKTNILNNNTTKVTNIYNKNNTVYNNIKDIVSNILAYLNNRIGVNYKNTNTKVINLIKLRLKEGFKVGDFKTVIDKKVEGWKGTSFEQYLNPFTLFGDKFELYLNQKIVKQEERENNSYGNNYRQPRKLRFDNFTGRTYDYDKLERQLLGWE